MTSIESALNFAIITHNNNDLDHIKRRVHDLSPQNIVDLIEALNESFSTIAAKDVEIEELREGLEIAADYARDMDNTLATLKTNVAELNDPTGEIDGQIETLTESVSDLSESMKEY